MNEHHFKKRVEEMIHDLEEDLFRFNEEWYQIHTENQIVENQTFLLHLAHDILILNQHAKEVEKTGLWQEGAHLIHYILGTPWGAPFVTNTTLLEAAQLFPDEIPLKSTLHTFTKQYVKYGTKCKFPILDALQQLQDEIHNFQS